MIKIIRWVYKKYWKEWESWLKSNFRRQFSCNWNVKSWKNFDAIKSHLLLLQTITPNNLLTKLSSNLNTVRFFAPTAWKAVSEFNYFNNYVPLPNFQLRCVLEPLMTFSSIAGIDFGSNISYLIPICFHARLLCSLNLLFIRLHISCS